MSSHHPPDLDSGYADSVSSSPRSLPPSRGGGDSDHPPPTALLGPNRSSEEFKPRVRFMCSFGGRIIPRPHDNELRYVGGETRIVAVPRNTTFSGLVTKLSKLFGNEVTVKYQLPNEDLDALISVTTDEDVENMMEEYDRLLLSGNKTARLRLFLFPAKLISHASLGTFLNGSKREHWFFDALNGSESASVLERGRSESSSIVSEVPDYLFGLDNPEEGDETTQKNVTGKQKTRLSVTEQASVSDPGSPVPATSPYCSSSSTVPCIPSFPDLPPVKTKPVKPLPEETETPENAKEAVKTPVDGFTESGENLIQQQMGYNVTDYTGNTRFVRHDQAWQFLPESQFSAAPQPMPVYYIPSPVPGAAVHYVQSVMPRNGVPPQIPMGFRQPVPGMVNPSPMGHAYRGGIPVIRPPEMKSPGEIYDYPAGMMPEGLTQQVLYRPRGPG